MESACGVRNDNGIGVRITGNFDNEAEYGGNLTNWNEFRLIFKKKILEDKTFHS